MKKSAFNLRLLKVMPTSPLENLVRQGSLPAVAVCRKRLQTVCSPAVCATEPVMQLRQASGLTMEALCREANVHLEDLQELMEMELGVTQVEDASASEGMAASVEPAAELNTENAPAPATLDSLREQVLPDFISDVARLLANLADLHLAFRLMDCLSQLPGRIFDHLNAATLLVHIKSSALLAVRYLLSSGERSPAEDVLKLLRIVRLLAMAGRFRSALATARLIVQSTRGRLRRDAVEAVRAIKCAYFMVPGTEASAAA